jgi:hypothetical protein
MAGQERASGPASDVSICALKSSPEAAVQHEAASVQDEPLQAALHQHGIMAGMLRYWTAHGAATVGIRWGAR